MSFDSGFRGTFKVVLRASNSARCLHESAVNPDSYSLRIANCGGLTSNFSQVAILVLLFLLLPVVGQCADQPSLLQLKQLAESGDVQAEFDYGARIEITNPAECEAMMVRAAEKGYGPAENWAGNHFSLRYSGDKNVQRMYRLQAALFTARAAYKEIIQSQSRLASFYSSGDILPRDPVLAYGWAAIAVKVSRATESPIVTSMYEGQLDRLIANTATQAIAEGQRFADAFKPQSSGLTRVEADLISSQLKLTGFIGGEPILNGVLMKPGIAHRLPIACDSIEVVCLGVRQDSAQFQFVGSNFFVILPLGLGAGAKPVVRSW